jgi:hypothetical protein
MEENKALRIYVAGIGWGGKSHKTGIWNWM